MSDGRRASGWWMVDDPLDELEIALFGDNLLRSRDEMTERAETLVAALREIARREYIGETTDGLRIDSAVHGREDANAIARAALSTEDAKRPTPKFPECVQPTARGRSVLRPPTPEGGAGH